MGEAAEGGDYGGEGPAEVLGDGGEAEGEGGGLEADTGDDGGAPDDGVLEGEEQEAGEGSEPDPEPERYTIKVGGEERSLTIDELQQLAQKGGGAEKKFEEASNLRKQLAAEKQAIIQDLQSDGMMRAYLKAGGGKAGRDAMLTVFADELDYDSLPDDERKSRDARSELERKAKRAEEYEAQEAARASAAQVQHYQEQFVGQMNTALEAVGMASSPAAIRRMSSLMEDAIDAESDVTVAQLAEKVRDDFGAAASNAIPSDPDALIAMLGPERLKTLRAHEAKRLKGRTAQIRRTKGDSAPRSRGVTKTTSSEFFRNLKGD